MCIIILGNFFIKNFRLMSTCAFLPCSVLLIRFLSSSFRFFLKKAHLVWEFKFIKKICFTVVFAQGTF